GGLRVTGGIPFEGDVRIQGSKNAALPGMAAALFNRGKTVLKGCRRIADVVLMEGVLKSRGAGTSWRGAPRELGAQNSSCCQVEKKLGERMRSSIVLLGSLLGRCKEAVLPFPGGCVIGSRPIDLHLKALRELGGEFVETEEGLLYGRTRGLKG